MEKRRNNNRRTGNRRPSLQVCTLSGTNEIGRNCNIIELGNEIIIVDAGYSFPGQDLYGIDYLVPNMKYLRKNVKNIRGIFITHGHQDHIGALPYILEDLEYPPIYAGAFAKALIEEKLREFDMLKKVKINTVRRNSEVKTGRMKIKFIGVNHSIPDSFSLFIDTPAGNVFVSGDYKIDLQPANEPETDYEALKALRGKIDLALLESTNASKPGKAPSETEISENLEYLIEQHDGRVIVAAFASLVTRLYSVMQIAQKTGRKVAVSGRSLETSVRVARKQGYIRVPDNLFVDLRKIASIPDDKLILLVTGSQAERYAALNRIALGEHRQIKAKKDDLVIMSSSDIPENVTKIERMTDKLIRQGLGLIKNGEENVHASGHGLQEDMKMMYEYIQPKYVMPVHGSLTFRYQNKKNYVTWGHPEDKVLLTDDGQNWIFTGSKWRRGRKVESKPILIDGLGVGDIGDVVIKDRRQLAEYGMFTVVINLHNKTNNMIGRPQFISRGFVYMKNSQKMLKEIENMIKDVHRNWVSKSKNSKRFERRHLTGEIERQLSRYIRKKTEREPIISVALI